MNCRDKAKESAEVLSAVFDQRGGDHGTWPENAAIAQHLKQVIRTGRGFAMPEHAEAVDAICAKMGRLASGDAMHKDTWVDIAGYALLAAGCIPEGEA